MAKIVIAYFLIVSVLFAQEKCTDNENEIEKIAIRFAEKILSGDTENILPMFSMTDDLKAKFLQTNSFKEWTSTISKQYGSVIGRENINTDIEDNRYIIRIQYRCERGSMTFSVFFQQQKIIAGCTWSQPDNTQVQKQAEWALTISAILTFVVLPLAIFLIIFFGEKWRAWSLRNREKDKESFGIIASEVYRESQNPIWIYVLLLAILLCIVQGIEVSFLASPNAPVALKTIFLGVVFMIFFVIGLIAPGIFVEVCEENLVVRMGNIKFKILTVSLKSIKSIDVVTFRPFKDFGGVGIRLSGDGAWVYLMSGTQGVQIVTNKNKKYIIGSDTPNLLCKVIQAKCHLEQKGD